MQTRWALYSGQGFLVECGDDSKEITDNPMRAYTFNCEYTAKRVSEDLKKQGIENELVKFRFGPIEEFKND